MHGRILNLRYVQDVCHGGHMHLKPSKVSKQIEPDGQGFAEQLSSPRILLIDPPLQKLDEQMHKYSFL
jgi:hypothetical protein